MKTLKNRILAMAAALLLLITFSSMAATPVVNIDSITSDSEGKISVELSTAEEYNIVEMRISPGNHTKEDFNSASPIVGGKVSGIAPGNYTVFVKDKDGNIGAYPMEVGESHRKEQIQTESSSSSEEQESYEYGGSWLEYSVESDCCTETKATEKEKSNNIRTEDPAPIPETVQEQEDPAPILPQTGGYFETRMLSAIGIVFLAIIGSILLLYRKKTNL